MFKKILMLLLHVLFCDRCHGFINEGRGYYVSEKGYEYQTNQRLDKNICKSCYRLLPTYLQNNYEKVSERKEQDDYRQNNK